MDTNIIQTYAPIMDSNDNILETLYAKLQSIINNTVSSISPLLVTQF